jgi:hypothetical protein
MMEHYNIFSQSEKDTEIIRRFEGEQTGNIKYTDRIVSAVLERNDATFLISIDEIIDFDLEETDFPFTTGKDNLFVSASIIAHRNSVNVGQKTAYRYSEGKVYSFRSADFNENAPGTFKAYYPTKHTRVIYDLFGAPHAVSLRIDEAEFFVGSIEGYIIIESVEKITYEVFSETCYSIMVALGFLSGHFVQTETYFFQQRNHDAAFSCGFKYRKLRASSSSMYHALTHNPYGYAHMIGSDYADDLYNSHFLKPIDEKSFSQLVDLIHNNSQVQYALVLFNEANDNGLSLLIKNNCFFAVLEVLRKFLHDRFENHLPATYSQRGNIEKYKLVFEQQIPINEDECNTLKKRNAFLHGDIKNISGPEMVEIMQKQITLIYRLLLSLTGFDGHVVDHYAIRNNIPQKAFIKVN